ncbi:hypothetical protein JXA48_02870 [Candidatus Woesearchaeota archaeon]|nr:hypothetical protein [Candidatus Woesearchaeota archaeon]
MRKHDKYEYINIRTASIALVVLIILIIVIWRPFSSAPETSTDNFESLNLSLDVAADVPSIPATDIPTKKLGKDDLCKEYIFRDGDTLNILNHEILVEAIGSKSVKVVVDGERKILSEEENVYFESGLRLGMAKGSLFYYAVGSDENVAEIMVGCKYGDNLNDKYIQDKGELFCRSSYEQCLNTFGVEN